VHFVDPYLPRHVTSWHSPALGMEMPVVTYGDRGRPVLLFPTAAGDFLEAERMWLVKAVEPLIFAGRVRLFVVDSINRMAWMDRGLPVPEQARRQALYSRYVEEEAVPFVRDTIGAGWARIVATGASFGAFYAANAFFRRPDYFDGLIAMSGFYDLGHSYLHGYGDDNVYFNNPASYVPHLGGEALDTLRRRTQIVLVTGQGEWEAPHRTGEFSELLSRKEIPHRCDYWGHDVAHDWPWWRRMLPHYLEGVS
jgi:esterase/lipase superfamily enzyme